MSAGRHRAPATRPAASRLGAAARARFGGRAARGLARSTALAVRAGEQADWAAGLDDDELATAAGGLRGSCASGPHPFDTDDELVRFLALAREAAQRTVAMRPFDVQLLGAQRLLAGEVVQMATGEGKTLAGAIAAAAFALRGRRVHVISVNDYLARRDAEWMGPLHAALGVRVGWVAATVDREHRRTAYAADVCHGSVSEIGFDVLRDRLVTDPAARLAPEPDVALVDEADSVLVDEALVPLVIAGAVAGSGPATRVTDVVARLRPGVHHETDAEERNVHLTEAGSAVVERALGGVDLYAPEHLGLLTQVNVALHAQVLLTRDVHYLVRDGAVALINAARGRVAHLQRWPDGLQAAVEAKEGLAVSESGEVLDTTTVQGLIRRYPRVCGMTGTATAARDELRSHYDLAVSTVPPHVACVRVDEPHRLYATVAQKEAALVAFVAARHAEGQPVLVGTQDVVESERLAQQLRAADVACVVLNAKNDAEEAEIVAEAGAPGAVVVSTQIAGRGTDIRLGGSDMAAREEVVAAGGLCVVGCGRHTSSRLDTQLAGRAGRQGDPGRSVLFASVADDLVAQHTPDAEGFEADAAAPGDAGPGDSGPGDSGPGDDAGRLTSARALRVLEHAQRVSEAALEQLHRNTWRYNQLLEHQRRLLVARRDEVLGGDAGAVTLRAEAPQRWAELAETVSAEGLAAAARAIVLFHLDRCWAEHLAMGNDLRESIHLRALSRESPLDEFHRAMIPAFAELDAEIAARSVETFSVVAVTDDGADLPAVGLQRPTATWTYLVHDNPFGSEMERATAALGGRRSRAPRR